jgi:hypothetical protein
VFSGHHLTQWVFTLQDHAEDCKKKGSKIADLSCGLPPYVYTIYIIFTILHVTDVTAKKTGGGCTWLRLSL